MHRKRTPTHRGRKRLPDAAKVISFSVSMPPPIVDELDRTAELLGVPRARLLVAAWTRARGEILKEFNS